MAGTLACTADGRRFPIHEGVPLLRPDDVDVALRETAARFYEEWKRWSLIHDFYERQFLEWIHPVAPADFRDKIVFEGGCGKGRHSSIVAGFGPRALVSLDLGDSAFVAFANTRHLTNVHVAVGDLLRPPVRRVFDLAFSVGVLHHLPEPAEAFASLVRVVKDGGRVVAWVYGLENNEWIVRFVDPVRKALTARMPSSILRALAIPPAAILWAAINSIYRGRSSLLGVSLPYAGYFAGLRGFPFAEVHLIVFDQLVTPVAHYLPGDEVRGWVARGFRDVTVRWKDRYSWTVAATIGARSGD